MTSVLEAVRRIVDPRRVIHAPVELKEEAASSRCGPISVRYEGECWALRLRDGDHLPILAELAKERSVRRLPDYLVFSAPRASGGELKEETLRILVCELKSSAGGAESAMAQLQLGKLLAHYLVTVAAHSLGKPEVPEPWCCGLLASPEFPQSMLAKGRTRPGKVELPNSLDKLSRMRVYQMPGGGEVRLESFY